MSDEIELSKQDVLSQLESLRPDLMFPEHWDSESVDLAKKTVENNKAVQQMFKSIPMVCRGDKCPQKSSCPLYEKNLHPIGSACPIELRAIRDISEALGKSLDIDYDDFTEVSQLRVMVDQEIQYIRKSSLLAQEGFIMENVVGISNDGEVITKKELSLAVELEDRIHRRLKQYRSELIATREARAKVAQGEVDSAKVVSKVLKEISQINAERERLLALRMGDILDESEVIDADIIGE